MSTFVKATQVYQQGQRTLPGRYYTSAEIYAEEQERIFTARWICAGRAAEIPEAGDYVLRKIAGESVIVVRGPDGALRAFYNVCRHRGTLEARLPKLFRVPALPRHSPRTRQAHAVHERRQRPVRRAVPRRLHGHYEGRGEPDAERARLRGAGRSAAGGGPASCLLLFAVPEPAPVAAPGLRDVPHALAGGSGPDADQLRMAVPSRLLRATRVRPRRRGAVLGRDEPPGLAHLRTEPRRHHIARLRARALLAARGDFRRVGPGIPESDRARPVEAQHVCPTRRLVQSFI